MAPDGESSATAVYTCDRPGEACICPAALGSVLLLWPQYQTGNSLADSLPDSWATWTASLELAEHAKYIPSYWSDLLCTWGQPAHYDALVPVCSSKLRELAWWCEQIPQSSQRAGMAV